MEGSADTLVHLRRCSIFLGKLADGRSGGAEDFSKGRFQKAAAGNRNRPQDFSGGSLAHARKELTMAGTKNGGSGREQQGESRIDEDERIQFMKRHGLTIPQIAEKLAIDSQSVRKRLQLLRLTPRSSGFTQASWVRSTPSSRSTRGDWSARAADEWTEAGEELLRKKWEKRQGEKYVCTRGSRLGKWFSVRFTQVPPHHFTQAIT
jgi:hypothetical protein